MGLSSLFYKNRDARTPSSSWNWPSCKQARTSSFRAGECAGEDGCDAINCSFADDSELEKETLMHGLLRSSDRLIFEPGATSSILDDARASRVCVEFEGSIAVPMESNDPYRDFRASMEEMVVAYGVRGWGWLEEMLGWYLRVNGRRAHGFILGAFMDLLLMLSTVSSSSSYSSSCSLTSFSFENEELDLEEGGESS